MKKSTLTLAFLLLVTLTYSADPKIIEKPFYEFSNIGILSVKKIHLTDSATYLTIHSDFIPGLWIMFTDDISIRDTETGDEYKVLDIQGAVFNEQLWMPESGDSSVVLVFPPLPASVTQIDYHNFIYGISLDKSRSGTKAKASILPEIEKWISDELAKSTLEPLKSYVSDDFFNETPARLIGCIIGYDPRAGFSTGIIHVQNVLTHEDFPLVVQIQDDGRFDVEIPMVIPQNTQLSILGQLKFPFYIEPGQTLAMIIDWDGILVAQRKQNIRYKLKGIEYKGALGALNHELINFPADDFNFDLFMEKVKTMSPLDFKKESEMVLGGKLERVEKYLAENHLSEKAHTIIRNSIIVRNATELFDYVMYRESYASEDTANEALKMPVPASYYEFLQQIDLNDKSLLLTDEFSTFINRFEHCTPFSKANNVDLELLLRAIEPEKSLREFLKEQGVELSDEEFEMIKLTFKTEKTEDEMNTLKNMEDFLNQFYAKHSESMQKWVDKYLVPLIDLNICNIEREIWKERDSILANELGLMPNLVYDIAKIRSLKNSFSNYGSKESAYELWSYLKQGIRTPFLVQTGNTIFDEAFPDVEIASTPLPEGIGTDIFRKIIEPHKGKILVVNFWATTCGPCIHTIRNTKHLREKHAGNPDFDFVFITDLRSSPEDHYNNFVKEQELTNSYRVSLDEFNHLKQLFKFMGIPRYVIIDRNGHVINDNFNMHNFEVEMAEILTK